MSKKEVCIAFVILVSCAILVCYNMLLDLRPHKASDKLYTIRKIERVHRWCLAYETTHGEFPHETDWPRDLAGWSLGEYESLDSDDRKEHLKYFKYLCDAWKRPFRYRSPGIYNSDLFDIYSAGQNGIDEGGGGDDLGNWEQPSHMRGYLFEEMTKDWRNSRMKDIMSND